MATLIGTRQHPQALWRDYLELTKPKVVVLMLITSLVGMFLATRAGVPWTVLVFGNLGIGLCAGGAAAVNHVVDRRIDAQMARTHKRPLAEGRVSPRAALAFALLLALAGQALLLAFTNPLTAWLTLASLLGYAVVYTGFLKRATPQNIVIGGLAGAKRATPQNIVIGGLAGAAPPLLGWVAATGHLSAEPLLLVLIIFAWTPPHFWALAIHRKEEYAKADIPMLPVTHGEQYTKVHILLYTFALLAVSLLPFVIHMSGVLYLACALILGGRFLQWAWVLYRGTRPHAAIDTFKYSIYYLFLLFIALLVDHYLLLNL
ncbi:protoheme IX farnesyltransferase [Pseudomonas sp. CMR5c]|uniref:protoheme IX farnesyltransferase n=2 Tax=unclassified Pseudomonas TaxID=196821 RepID=UPI00069DF6FD|nr:protoheme IX farnesyltransferase [Pseudomonas sp. CMR5c]